MTLSNLWLSVTHIPVLKTGIEISNILLDSSLHGE